MSIQRPAPFSHLAELEKLVENRNERPTRAMPAVTAKRPARALIPPGYCNPTLSPYVLIIAAIIENRRYMYGPVLPKALYVTSEILEQLSKDIMHCTGQDFNGHSIPFTLFDGKIVHIPVFSARKGDGVTVPKHTVWCAN
ncbi:MAG TPA: hypothetical protein VHV10_05165 [Ktedonobacteraceae bacterium]|nr:hypothetical protein [Ktedonobacteraceae bacterium]